MVMAPECIQQFRTGHAELIPDEAVKVDRRYTQGPADIPEREAGAFRKGGTCEEPGKSGISFGKSVHGACVF